MPSSLTIDAPAEADIGTAVSFRAGSQVAVTGLSFSWDFGDGSTSTEAQPVHAYPARGDYTVTLTVRNAAGSTATARAVLPVWPAITTLDQLHFIDPLRGHALANDGMLLSTADGGQHWRRSALPLAPGTEVRALRFEDVLNGWLVLARGSDRRASVQRSADGGKTWHPVAEPSVRLDAAARLWWPQRDALVINGLAPDGPEAVSVISTDGGQHWRRAALRVEGVSRGNRLWGVAAGWLRYSADAGLTAQALLEVPEGSAPSAVDLADPADMVVILATPYFKPAPGDPASPLARQLHHRSRDGGQHWVRTPVQVPSPLNLMFNLQLDGQRGLASVYVGEFDGGPGMGAVRTVDGGLSWSEIRPPGSGGGAFTRTADIADAHAVVLSSAAPPVVSFDSGATLRPFAVADEAASAFIALAPAGAGIWLADFGSKQQVCRFVGTGSVCEVVSVVERSYLSTDGGVTWVRLPGRHLVPAAGP